MESIWIVIWIDQKVLDVGTMHIQKLLEKSKRKENEIPILKDIDL